MDRPNLKDIFRKNLLRLIAESGQSQSRIAKELDIHMPTFNAWCTGASVPRMEKLEALAAYFDVEPADLLRERGDDDPISDFELLKAFCYKMTGDILNIPPERIRSETERIMADSKRTCYGCLSAR